MSKILPSKYSFTLISLFIGVVTNSQVCVRNDEIRKTFFVKKQFFLSLSFSEKVVVVSFLHNLWPLVVSSVQGGIYFVDFGFSFAIAMTGQYIANSSWQIRDFNEQLINQITKGIQCQKMPVAFKNVNWHSLSMIVPLRLIPPLKKSWIKIKPVLWECQDNR